MGGMRSELEIAGSLSGGLFHTEAPRSTKMIKFISGSTGRGRDVFLFPIYLSVLYKWA